MELVEKLVFPE
jgi:hypothetical protein